MLSPAQSLLNRIDDHKKDCTFSICPLYPCNIEGRGEYKTVKVGTSQVEEDE